MPAEATATLSEEEWRARQARHQERLGPFVSAHLKRRSCGQKHPVWDFLFEYYSFKPAHLLRPSPGLQVLVRGDTSAFESWKEFHIDESGAQLNLSLFPPRRIEALQSVIELLRRTHERAAFHGCLGLHEWAMVYRSDEVRHEQAGLRLAPQQLAELVESQTICCSHYDAFRFFTAGARSLNVLQPAFEDRAALEQPGCIHANMDLYKWSHKFYPWISSELIVDAFELAVEARELDMRASPYDLSAWGFEPIRIETPEGRREYQAAQRAVAQQAAPLRARLLGALRELSTEVACVRSST